MADEGKYSPSEYNMETVKGFGELPFPALVARNENGCAWQIFNPIEIAEDRMGVQVGAHVELDGKVYETRIFYTIEAFDQVLKSAQDALDKACEQRDYNQKHQAS